MQLLNSELHSLKKDKMPETNITNSSIGDFQNTITDFSVASVNTDAATGEKETIWINSNWPKYLGYYKTIPELAAAIDAKATWTIGKGFKSNEITWLALSTIKGWGKDTFNTILENAVRTYHIGGDAFCEIIRNNEGRLINLKPLDPGTIRIVANEKGIILRYEQISKTKNSEEKKFQPDEILHLSRNRVADEIHGVSIIPAVENIILMRNEAMNDYKKLLHRNVYPVHLYHLDTDNPTKIAAFKAKADLAHTQGENIFVPKGAVEHELMAVPGNATLNPLPWIQQLNQYFFQATGVPQIIVGGSQEMTEASAKISYLAFEQTIEEEQLYLEEQILAQLNLEIELEFPASLQNELLSDTGKEEKMQAATNEDTNAMMNNKITGVSR
jgi:hypothetical protein